MIKNRLFLSLILLVLLSVFSQAVTLEGQIYDYQLNELDNVLVEIDTVPSQQFLSKDGSYSFELDEGEYTLKASKTNLIAEDNIVIESNNDNKFLHDLFLFPDLNDEDDLWDDLSDIESDEEPEVVVENKDRTWAYVVAVIIFIIALVRIRKAKQEYKGGKKESDKEITTIRIEVDKDEKPSENKTELAKEAEERSKIVEEVKKEIKKFTKEEALSSIEQEQPGYIDRTLDIIRKHDGRITQKELRKELIEISESKVSLILTELEHTNKIEKVKRGRGNVILLKENLKE